MGFFDFVFKLRKQKIETYLRRGALIIDVRTEEEYSAYHIPDTIHIPLNKLDEHVRDLQDSARPIITCCASGIRSSKAAKFLNLHNIEAINGGGWKFLKKIKDRVG